MMLDTPATIAIIGAGPVGLEAGLYARYLGYDVVVWERGEVAETVRRRGDESLDQTWNNLVSRLGLAALAAQSEHSPALSVAEKPTARQWLEQYLIPLSQTDLLVDHLRLACEVVAVSAVEREPAAPDDEPLPEDAVVEIPFPFAYRLTIRTAAGEVQEFDVDAVINAGGGQGKDLGPGSQARTPGDCWSLFHLLGAGSPATGEKTSFVDGLDQIRRLFAELGGRPALDLYRSF